jgi:hypothetical protein
MMATVHTGRRRSNHGERNRGTEMLAPV